MDGEDEQPEFGVSLVVEDVVEVEFDVGLFGEAGRVTQEPHGVPVGDDAPQAWPGAVEEFLDHGLGGSGGHSRCGCVEGDTGADEVHRDGDLRVGSGIGPGELVGDRVVRGVGFAEPGREVDAGGQCVWSAVAEFVQQG